jgi:hypothetical protein
MLERLRELSQQADAPNLYWSLAGLPRPFIDARAVMQWERSFIDFSFPRDGRLDRRRLGGAGDLRGADLPPPEQWQQQWDDLAGMLTAWDPQATKTWEARAGMALLAARTYPAAKAHLLAAGVPPERVEKLPVQYVVSVYYVREYRRWSDEVWKWFLLPPWQGAEGMARSQAAFDEAMRTQLIANPLASLVPAVRQARMSLTRLDRTVAALQTVEAIRAHATAHDGRPPASLDEMRDTPAPADPGTGEPFGYEADGDGGVVLEVPALPGEPPQTGVRYEITVEANPRR